MSTQLTYRNLVKGIEVWEPSVDESRLVWASGTYGSMDRFGAVSRETSFRPGEGLPGLVWRNRCPVIMHGLSSGAFLRASEASEESLDCGVGIPFFCGDSLRGVLVFLCDAGDDVQGAFEIWRLNDRHELGLETSYYANLDQFSRLSHFVKFPRGAGLPGQAWQMRFPRVLDSLADSPAFMRSAGARADDLQVGLGLPLMRSDWDLDSVVVMLSSRHTPLARVFEVWMREDSGGFSLHSGAYGDFDELRAISTNMRLPRTEGLAGVVGQTGGPLVVQASYDYESSRASYLRDADLGVAVSMPFFVGSHFVAVVHLFL